MYQTQPSYRRFVPQVLPEVKVVRVLTDKAKRMFFGAAHSYQQRVGAGKKAAHADLVVEPLWGLSTAYLL